MKFERTTLDGVWIIEPRRFGDERGYFMETFRMDEFERNVGRVNFVQDNESVSQRDVLRGLHLQAGEFSQAKLVRVSRGAVVDVVVDLRSGSKTRGKWLMVELSAENSRQLFVPRGFAHGFMVKSDEAQFQYKVDNAYAPQSEMTLRYDDPSLKIDWPLDGLRPILSEKDRHGKLLDEVLETCGF